MRRTVMTGIGIMALAAGSAIGQSAGSGGGSGGGGIGSSPLEVATAARLRALAQEGAVGVLQPSQDASINRFGMYLQGQPGQSAALRTSPVEIDGKPVSLRVTGASLQVYLGDEPYPESRMKTEGDRTLLLDAGGKPGAQMLVQGQRVMLVPIGAGQQGGGEGRLLIGVSLSPVDSTLAGHLGIEAEKASLISSVTESWPASKAGLQSGDIIVSVEGKDEGTSEAIRAAIAERKAGDPVRLRVISGGERKDVTIRLSDEARAPTTTNLASVLSSAGDYAGAQDFANAARLADLYTSAQSGAYREQLQRAQELAAASRLRWADEAAVGAARRSSEQAEAEARRARERVAVVQRQNDWAIASSDGARVTVDIPAGGGRAVVAPGAQSDISRRLSALEERMARIEALLQQIAEKSGAR